ncbi:MAG: pentapeptide repeat-containing protein [Archangium sp.]|nr:pentapeptide repeat-containing protein [Archangium sp.]
MTLSEELRRGPRKFNARRKAGEIPLDQSGATLSHLFFAKADLSKLDLSNSEFEDCEVSDCDFRGASLEGAYVHGGRFERCDFRGARLSGATFEGVEFAECDFEGATGFDTLELLDTRGLGGKPATVSDQQTAPLAEEPKFVAGKVAVDEARERDIDAHPNDAARWLVYGDWLQSEGDVRGELVTRHGKPGFATFVQDHLESLFPSFADELRGGGQAPEVELEFRHGLVHGALLHALSRERPVKLGELAHRVLAAPACRFIRRLSFGLNHDVTHYGERQNDYAPVIESLIKEPKLQRLTHLEFGIQEREVVADEQYDREPLHSFGDLSELWPHVPHLEQLTVQGNGGTLGNLELPSLRVARFLTDNPDEQVVDEILAARWPKLEHFELWEFDSEFDLEALLHALSAVPLKHLALPGMMSTDRLFELLLAGSLLKKLKVLDVHDTPFSERSAAFLLRNVARFSHLERLDLSDSQFDVRRDDAVAKLPFVVLDRKRALPTVEQYEEPSDDEYDDGPDDSDLPEEAMPPEAPNADLDIPDEHGD